MSTINNNNVFIYFGFIYLYLYIVCVLSIHNMRRMVVFSLYNTTKGTAAYEEAVFNESVITRLSGNAICVILTQMFPSFFKDRVINSCSFFFT